MSETCSIVCENGETRVSLEAIRRKSIKLEAMLSESCLCTATIILPDLDINCVDLAMGLLASEVDRVTLESDIIDIVGQVYDCLGIEYISEDKENIVKLCDIF